MAEVERAAIPPHSKKKAADDETGSSIAEEEGTMEDAMDVEEGARAPRCEPTLGTGTGSEVIEIARAGNDLYRVTTRDGRQDVLDKDRIHMLPQGMARLATLQVREQMAAKRAGNDARRRA